MSINVSKKKRDDLIKKIKEIRTFIAKAEQDENAKNLLGYLGELEKELKGKKYGLVFEEHREAIDDIMDTHTPVLTEDKNLFIDNSGTMNFLIEGDNLPALKLLGKTHKGMIDVIYIDPPYNTGAKDWKYDNSYVDKNDTFKHSKWLNLLKSRLLLAKYLLKSSGIICITIDDYEMPNLWLLMDEIFGEENRLGTVTIRNNPKGRMTKRKISQTHEYALFYGKTQSAKIKKIPVDPEEKSHNYVKDENNKYYVKVNLRKQGVDSEAVKPDGTIRERYFPVYYDPTTGRISTEEKLPIEILPIDTKGNKRIWRRNQEGIKKLIQKNDLMCSKIGEAYQLHFRFRGGLDGEVPKSIWNDSFFSASEYGTTIINDILGREKFPYPKSLPAVVYALKCSSNNKKAIILDFFAGSGTTGHAVLEMNKDDQGKREFILVTNNENNICQDITYERIKRVIEKEDYKASLKYYKVDFVPIDEQLYYEYADQLLLHVRELVELENGINFIGNAKVAIVLTDEELKAFIENIDTFKKCKTLYLGHDVLTDGEQEALLKERKIKVNVIPDYYYRELEG